MEIITASLALPMTNNCPVLKNGAIAIEGEKIRQFGPVEDLKERYPDAEVKSFSDGVLMPGLTSAHCHLDLVSFYETTSIVDSLHANDPHDFAETLVATLDFKSTTAPDKVIAGIQKGINRLIETGVTCVGDMTHYEGTFKLLREMGMRAVVFPEIVAGRGEAAQQRFEIALALVEKYTDPSDDRVRAGLGPFAPYLLSRNLLKIISRHARDASIPLMIHASESFSEMEFFFDSQGSIATDVFPNMGWDELPAPQHKTPIAYLEDIGFLEAPTIIVGGIQLSGKDFQSLARHMTRIVQCPTMNKRMKHGVFPAAKLHEHGIPMGLGLDCWHTRMGFNLWEEMRLAVKKGWTPSSSAKEALQLATIGGARTLGLDHLTGTLEEGKRADFIVVKKKQTTDWSKDDDIYTDLVMNTEPHHVEYVVVDGDILKAS